MVTKVKGSVWTSTDNAEDIGSFFASLGDYADDAAAAAGGVAVSELYRTGSTIKVRIA